MASVIPSAAAFRKYFACARSQGTPAAKEAITHAILSAAPELSCMWGEGVLEDVLLNQVDWANLSEAEIATANVMMQGFLLTLTLRQTIKIS